MAICVTRAAARLSCVAVIQMLLSHTALSASSPSQDTSGVPLPFQPPTLAAAADPGSPKPTAALNTYDTLALFLLVGDPQ